MRRTCDIAILIDAAHAQELRFERRCYRAAAIIVACGLIALATACVSTSTATPAIEHGKETRVVLRIEQPAPTLLETIGNIVPALLKLVPLPL